MKSSWNAVLTFDLSSSRLTEPLLTGNVHLSEKGTLAHFATVRSFLSSWSLTSPVQERLKARNVIWIRPCTVALEALTPAAFHSLNPPWISITSLNGLRFAPFLGHFFVLSALQECAWMFLLQGVLVQEVKDHLLNNCQVSSPPYRTRLRPFRGSGNICRCFELSTIN